MAIYYALITGEGEGCDYTIACNKDFRRLKATTLEEAKREAIEYDCIIDSDGRKIQNIDVVEAAGISNMSDEIDRAIGEYAAAEEKRRLTAKRTQLEKLKRELGEA